LERSGVAALGSDAAKFEKRRQVFGSSRENLLDDLLKLRLAVIPALALNFESKLVVGAEIAGVQFDGLTKVGDGSGGIAAIALNNAEKLVNSIVRGSKIPCAIEPLSRDIEAALSECENAPVGPCGRFRWNQFGGISQARVRSDVITHL
jgi:hypothetical protein